MKKLVTIVLSIIISIALFAGCGNSQPKATDAPKSSVTVPVSSDSPASSDSSAQDETVVIKFSTAESSTSVLAEVLTEMIAELNEKSNGTIVIQPYYSNELGTLSDVVEQIALGGNIMANASGDFFANYGCPDITSIALFYAVPNMESLQKLNKSDLFASWCDQIEASSGLKVLCCNWAAAPRNIISTKPINSVKDIKGLKIRVPGTAADAFFSALGASTMTMSFSEVYTSLDSGMIEAAEAALGGLYDYALHEVAKNVYLSEHSLAPGVVALSSSVWKKLTPEKQQILKDAVNKYGDVYTQRCLDLNDSYRKKMEEAGVIFVEPSESDKEAMKAAGAASFEAFPELSEGLAEKLAEAMR